MKRYSPDVNVNIPLATMEEDSFGEYVNISDVYHWLLKQRNEIPATGEEFANAFLYEIGDRVND